MTKRILLNGVLLTLFCFGLEGCLAWPVMTENYGQRPIEMGKQDQVFSPTAPQPTKLSRDFGMAQKVARDSQILNPEPSGRLDPVEGLDGDVGVKAVTRYRKFFEKPPFEKKSGYGSKAGGGKKKK